MFSCNGKISEKQMRRMLVLPTFAGCIFVLPYLSARLFRESVFTGLLVFFVFACIYVACIHGIGEWYQKKRKLEIENSDMNETLSCPGFVSTLSHTGIGGKLLLIIPLLRHLFRLAFYIVLAMEILGEAQVPFMQGTDTRDAVNLLVVLPLLLVALYGSSKRIEQNARLHEMIFWVMLVPFIIMLLFGLWEVDYRVFVPRLDMPAGRILLYGYALLTFIQPVETYLYLRPILREGKRPVKHLTFPCAELFVIMLSALLSLFILGIYGVHGAGSEEMVTIAIMRYIRLPFGVLERFDMLMVWFFMTGCFVLICNSLYHAEWLLHILCGKTGKEQTDGDIARSKQGRKKWPEIFRLVIILLLAVGIVVLLPQYSHTLLLFMCYGGLLDIPLSLLVPLAGIGLSQKFLKQR